MHRPRWREALKWVRGKDPDLLAVKRSVRAAAAMPLTFGVAHLVWNNPQISLFGAFGAFSLLLLVDFHGRPRARLGSYSGLFAVGAAFISVGTVVSTRPVLAVVSMAVVAFGVLFAGVVTPQAATGATAALLTFVLPVAVAGPSSAVGPRLVGWLLAGVVCIPACLLVWPPAWHDQLRCRLADTVAAVAALASARAQGDVAPDMCEAVARALAALRQQFRATPYPPTGAAATAVALAKLVGRVEWVAGDEVLAGVAPTPFDSGSDRAVVLAVADTMGTTACLISASRGHPVDDPLLVEPVQASILRLDVAMKAELDTEVTRLLGSESTPAVGELAGRQGPSIVERPGGIASTLDPSFGVRALGIAVEMVADAALEAAGAQAVGDRRLGPAGESAPPTPWAGITSHLSFRSVWFRNAVRGAVGLALAVAVVEITDVEHGFWVVLGTLSVLRTNALGTGATALRAVGGTAVGFLVGSAIMVGVGAHSSLLWALLPIAVLLSGVAPSMISFAAGQAGFTVVVVILFNIIDPIGWTVGLTRIEDVAIGCGVSIVVGLLFWPRGATAALGRALSDAFSASSGYLSDAVDRLTMLSHSVETELGQRASHRAYLRLDDAFRQYLAERGSKRVAVDTVAALMTGSNRIRLGAYTLATLPLLSVDPDKGELEAVAVAGSVLRDSYAASHRWYEEFSEVLADQRDALDPVPSHNLTLHGVLQTAFEDARRHGRGDELRRMLQMLWADELLEAQRQVQTDLADSAGIFARQRHGGLFR